MRAFVGWAWESTRHPPSRAEYCGILKSVADWNKRGDSPAGSHSFVACSKLPSGPRYAGCGVKERSLRASWRSVTGGVSKRGSSDVVRSGVWVRRAVAAPRPRAVFFSAVRLHVQAPVKTHGKAARWTSLWDAYAVVWPAGLDSYRPCPDGTNVLHSQLAYVV